MSLSPEGTSMVFTKSTHNISISLSKKQKRLIYPCARACACVQSVFTSVDISTDVLEAVSSPLAKSSKDCSTPTFVKYEQAPVSLETKASRPATSLRNIFGEHASPTYTMKR